MSVSLNELPTAVSRACRELTDDLTTLLSDDLVALWAYGAATFEDRPKRLGDVDTHAVLAKSPDAATANAIDEHQASIAADCGIEWDSWFIVESDARGPRPPLHAFRENLLDRAWALHRAHWLAGQFVALHGRAPSDVVPAPTWAELEEALLGELLGIEQWIDMGKDDPRHMAFDVWNSCRIIYSLETRDVVVSKRAAANWALDHLPNPWHAAIRAAGRVYDAEDVEGDDLVMQSAVRDIVAAARSRFASETRALDPAG